MSDLEFTLKQFELTRRWRRLPIRGRFKLYWSNRPMRRAVEPGVIAFIRVGLERKPFYSLEELEKHIEKLEEGKFGYVD